MCSVSFFLGNRNTYITIGLVSASLLVGLMLACGLCYLYQKRTQRQNIDITKANQEHVGNENGMDNSKESSLCSIYDELELYESARAEGTHPTSPYTVMNRDNDPYAYDELFGFQGIAIGTENSDQSNEEPSTSNFKAMSLPADLNAITDDTVEIIEEEEYVSILPEKQEVSAGAGKIVQGCMERSKSMSDVVKTEKGDKTKDKRKVCSKNAATIGNPANVVSVKVEIH